MTDIKSALFDTEMLLRARLFPAAVARAQAAMEFDPADPMALGLSGVALVLAGERSVGVQRLKAANQTIQAKIDGSDGSSLIAAWSLRRLLLGDVMYAASDGSLEQATDLAKLLIHEVHMGHPRALRALGVVALKEGRLENAEKLLSGAVAMLPSYAAGWYALGCAFARLGRKAEMLDALTKAVHFGLSESVADYRRQMLTEEDLRAYWSDPQVCELADPLPKEPELRPVYEALEQKKYDEVLALGATALTGPADALAVMQAMREAVQCIVRELVGPRASGARQYLRTPDAYSAELGRLDEEIQKAKRGGSRSGVFRTYVGV